MNLNKTYLGIEFGSTRIKACLTDERFTPVSSGSFEWENKFKNGYWTYPKDEILQGLKKCFASLKEDFSSKFGKELTSVSAMGISGMMHGYLAFDENDNLLVPFRTWRNTTTKEASEKLTEIFKFNIPERWSIAHLYQAILNEEEHVDKIAHITTLAGYVHYLLTGRWEVGVGEASGIFPVKGNGYDEEMIQTFSELIKDKGYSWKIKDVLPEVRVCGEKGAHLTEMGARILDESGKFKSKISICPPEGDAGTGMVATNSVMERTGNVSAGTSVFSMLVLDKALSGVYSEIDVVTTPEGKYVAMVHSNNGCSELDVWVKMFGEFASLTGNEMDKSELYEILYKNALCADENCGNVVSYNFLAGEPVENINTGRPMYFRTHDSYMNLANFFRSQLNASVAVLKTGMDLLVKKENVTAKNFNAHGGLFKVKGVAQKILSEALATPVSVSETAGEGGAWGMALLSAYMMREDENSLGEWLDKCVFRNIEKETIYPDKKGVEEFERFYQMYKSGLCAAKKLEEV